MDDSVHQWGGAAVCLAHVDFPLVAAEVESFLDFPAAAAISRNAFLELFGTVSSGIETEVRLNAGGGENQRACQVLQGGCRLIIQFAELAEGGPAEIALVVFGHIAGGIVAVIAGLALDHGLGDGEWAIIEWRGGGTFTGPLGDLPPTGRAFTLRGCGFFRITEGKIGFQRGYFDRHTWFCQLGIPMAIKT